METVIQSVSLPVSKKQAWDLIANFINPHKYFGGITNAHQTSANATGVGASRHCELPNKFGMKQFIDEEITVWTEGEEFTYIVTNTAAPIKNGIATWRVSGDDHNSKIHVDIKYEPAGLMGVIMKSVLKREFNNQIRVGLDGVKQNMDNQRNLAA